MLWTKITPPRPSTRVIDRPRITEVLRDALHHRLTILQAGAGYGKSTALVHLARHHTPTAWYQITREDSDPLVFLLYLTYSLRRAVPHLSGLPTATLEHWGSDRGPLPIDQMVDAVLNALAQGLDRPLLIILDDAHLALEGSSDISRLLDRFISLAPPSVHVVLATRVPLRFPSLSRWTARGDVLLLDQRVLAFRRDEVARLFADGYHYPLSDADVKTLHELTEGWAIALHMVWQTLRTGVAASLEDVFRQPDTSIERLLEALSHEVLGRQPPDVRRFLICTATLRQLRPDACNALTGRADAEEMLAYLEGQDLFVVRQEDGSLRYHHLVHRFLRRQASDDQRIAWHRRAAEHFATTGDIPEALYHYLKAGDHAIAAQLLADFGTRLLRQGRLDTLRAYLDAFPPHILRDHPHLLFFMGELARLHSRFDEALGWYQQAEDVWRARGQRDGIVRALRGQARVYLDTVNPSQAERYLQEALRLSDGITDRESLARLYELLAENRLNAGRAEEAERFRQEAQRLREEGPSDSQLYYRVLLRTGRLDEARHLLEEQARAEESHPVQTPRAHRETLLLLSLIYAFQGEGQRAYETAVQGTRRGEALNSPFVIAVGHMRQGHALMLLPYPNRYALAENAFLEAVRISRELHIPRLRVEAFWGLCRAYGYQGHLARAREVAEEGIRIAGEAGDEWIASLVRLAMGAGLAMAGLGEDARAWLLRAAHGFRECSDPFGATAAHLWLAWNAHRHRDVHTLRDHLAEALALAQKHNYDFLFLNPTLLGPPDARLWVPLLVEARRAAIAPAYATSLLERLGLAGVEHHPGYRLRVFTLGQFRLFRGEEEVHPQEWRRAKARALFQIFITFRGRPLEREWICEALWPDASPEAAHASFKVTLNALYNVLEPEREPGTPSAFIVRQGTTYTLPPAADIWIDVAEFDGLLAQAQERPREAPLLIERALSLFRGEYLPDARYEPWAEDERRRLNTAFLDAADALCEHYLSARRPAAAVELAQRMLAVDAFSERACRHLMRAYHLLGEHGQIARVYQECCERLRHELGVEPSQETQTLFYHLIQSPRA